jgi:hypothetical protein
VPFAATTPYEFHPHLVGKLATIAPPVDAEPTSFALDAADPTPAGVNPFADGAASDEVLGARGDVVTFTGNPLYGASKCSAA